MENVVTFCNYSYKTGWGLPGTQLNELELNGRPMARRTVQMHVLVIDELDLPEAVVARPFRRLRQLRDFAKAIVLRLHQHISDYSAAEARGRRRESDGLPITGIEVEGRPSVLRRVETTSLLNGKDLDRTGRRSIVSPVALMVVATIAIPRDAHAYVDPNSAGLLYQILFPLMVAATLAWRWIKETVAWLWNRIRRSTD